MVKIMKRKSSMMVGATYFLAFLLGIETGGLQYSVLKMANEFQLNSAKMGSIVSVYFFATIISPLITGALSDRIGKKKVMTSALCVFISGCIVASTATGIAGLYVGVFIMGLAFAAMESSSTAALSDYSPEKSGKYINIMQSVLSAGCLVSPIIMKSLMEMAGFSWRALFIICIILAVISLMLIIPSEFKVELQEIGLYECGNKCMPRVELYMILMILCIAIYLFTENGITYFADLFISVELDSPETATYALTLFWAAMTISRFVSGVMYKQEDLIIKLCFGITAILLVCISFIENAYVALFIYFLMGITCAPIWPITAGKLNRRYKEHTGLITGLVLIAGGAGGTVSPYITGMICDVAGMTIAFIVLAVAAGVGVAIIFICSIQKYNKIK